MAIVDIVARVPAPDSYAGGDPQATRAPRTPASAGGRDLRLDLFRGLALLIICIDHTHRLWLANYTVGKFMFFDAGEMFVFIAGYTAALVYGRYLESRGAGFAVARIYRRIGQIYMAQLALFAALFLFRAGWQLASGGPALDFAGLAVRALTLQGPFSLMYTLPVYMALLAVLPGLLLLLGRAPLVLLALSATLYVAELVFRWNPAAVGLVTEWANVLNWQFLFVIGLLARRWTAGGPARTRLPAWLPWLAVAAIVLFALAHVGLVRWSVLGEQRIDWLWGKRHLGVLRLANFLLAAWLIAILIGPGSRLPGWRVLAPVRLCGKHSLPIFWLGAVLAGIGSVLLTKLDDSAAMNVFVAAAAATALFGAALALERGLPATLRREIRLRLGAIRPAAIAARAAGSD